MEELLSEVGEGQRVVLAESEDDAQYIIVMDDAEGGVNAANAEKESIHGTEDVDSGTVFVVEQPDGSYQIVGAPNDSSNQVPMQNLRSSAGSKGKQKAGSEGAEPTYLVIEDENGQQVIVDAASILEESAGNPALQENIAAQLGIVTDSRKRARPKFARHAVLPKKPTLEDSKSAIVSEGTKKDSNSTPNKAEKVDGNDRDAETEEEEEFDWSRIDLQKLKFSLKYGCCFCGTKKYRNLEDLKRHRRACPSRDRLACNSCVPSKPSPDPVKSSHLSPAKRRTHLGLDMDEPMKPMIERGGKSVHGSTVNALQASGVGKHRFATASSSSSSAAAAAAAAAARNSTLSPQNLKCRVCGKLFVSAETLKVHLINVHLRASAVTSNVFPTSGSVVIVDEDSHHGQDLGSWS
ncbi:unnamed protein product [Notodromas monacha]|uniref:C2H2-type domain-containing protein n=1 Tax=Notodromas monacha TaxID=399045 RepID=A0A7R9BJ08_9CRUS|nr:unnamed protein product [Notodromas monacha]CAG0915005.1 unnamed protein product [Notodromas monacha]